MLAGKFPLAALMAIVGVILAVAVAMTSSRDEPPRYHKVLSIESMCYFIREYSVIIIFSYEVVFVPGLHYICNLDLFNCE